MLRGYVQSHQIHTELLGPEQSQRECVAEMWVDNENDMRGFQQDPVYAKYLHDDAEKFVDYSQAIYYPTREEILSLRSLPDRAADPADDMWSLRHGRSRSSYCISSARLPATGRRRQDRSSAGGCRPCGMCAAIHCLSAGRARRDSRGAGTVVAYVARVSCWRCGGPVDALQQLADEGGRSMTLLAQAERFLCPVLKRTKMTHAIGSSSLAVPKCWNGAPSTTGTPGPHAKFGCGRRPSVSISPTLYANRARIRRSVSFQRYSDRGAGIIETVGRKCP